MPANQPHLGQLNLGAQGNYKRVLFVCSGGMLRSATAAQWASHAKGWNTRNCGTMDAALPPMHRNLAQWAEKIYCMENHHAEDFKYEFPWAADKVEVLNIPDKFHYRHPALLARLELALKDVP